MQSNINVSVLRGKGEKRQREVIKEQNNKNNTVKCQICWNEKSELIF